MFLEKRDVVPHSLDGQWMNLLESICESTFHSAHYTLSG